VPALATLRALVVTLRPKQWVKNSFVAAPLVFAKQLGDSAAVGRSAAAVLAFCALSGAVYVLNDLVDVDKDRAHPQKCRRPIAAGALSRSFAGVVAALLAASGLGAAFVLAPAFGLVAALYLAQNLAYSFWLKEIVFVDVLVIASGFLLRVLGGAFAIPVPPSTWLLACTALLAAFLGFGKRAHELELEVREGERGKTRAVLARYDARVLRVVLRVLSAATTLAYVLYTQSAHTIEFFGTRNLIWTAPFCGLGIWRFTTLVERGGGESPTDAMLRDGWFMANLAAWSGAVLAVIYWA
jgi:4-hydroxybenzoate polyprenyltransferase